MKRDPETGRQYAIEANVGRPTGRSAIAEAGGVELLHTMYCDVAGLPLPNGRTQTYKGTKWIDVRHDLQSAFTLLLLPSRSRALRTLQRMRLRFRPAISSRSGTSRSPFSSASS